MGGENVTIGEGDWGGWGEKHDFNAEYLARGKFQLGKREGG